MIRYCVNCLLPHTKPDLSFDSEGICSACVNYRKRDEIDFSEKEISFENLFSKKLTKGVTYDCVVPVSGGKDSTFQVLKLLEYKINPLCVTASTCSLTPIGRENLNNIKSLGVDLIEFSPNVNVRRKLNRHSLITVGDISWPEHVSIFTIPVKIAVQFEIPLIVWGENSQNEYGGPKAAAESHILDRRWLEEFGGLIGMRTSDLLGVDGITELDLEPYTYPDSDLLQKSGVTGVFLGHYFPWDGLNNYIHAKAKGFKSYGKLIEGSFVDYENLDNYYHGIHDYFKFLKFGFSRATDIASLHIRRGRISRSNALEIVKDRDGKFPWSYLGRNLRDILTEINMELDEFVLICDKFTNKKLFATDSRGTLLKDKNGNLTKINYDNI